MRKGRCLVEVGRHQVGVALKGGRNRMLCGAVLHRETLHLCKKGDQVIQVVIRVMMMIMKRTEAAPLVERKGGGNRPNIIVILRMNLNLSIPY